MCFQTMFSRAYSSCSSVNTCLTKNCCRCSLAKLMQSCSKLWQTQKAKGEFDFIGYPQKNGGLRTPNNKKNSCNQPVFIKILKAKDVQQAYRLLGDFRLFWLCVNYGVDFVNNPNEKSPINCLQIKQKCSHTSAVLHTTGTCTTQTTQS